MKSTTRTIIGLLIAVVGVSFLLTNLDILPFSVGISDWWPLLIVAGGLLIWANNRSNYLWALAVIGLGVLFQLRELDIVDVNPWRVVWPVVIILVGISITMNRSSRKQSVAANEREGVTAILGGNETRIRSRDFKGGRAVAVLGGAVMDLRDVNIRKEATIDLFAFWGGIEVRVPDGVVVKNRTSAILGGVEDSGTSELDEGAPVLYIVGDVIMGGIEIKRS